MNIWAKLITNGKIKKQIVYEKDEKLVYSKFFDYIVVISQVFMHKTVGIVLGSARAVLLAFGNKDDRAVLALADTAADECSKLVHIRLVLRNDGSLGSCSDSRVLCEEAGITAHHLDEEDAVVGVCGVADLVHAFHYRIEGSVVAYRGIGAVKVVVNRTRETDARDIVLGSYHLRSCKGAVSSDAG